MATKLEKAMQIQGDRRGKLLLSHTTEDVDLAMAYFGGLVAQGALAKAAGIGRGSHYSWLMQVIRYGVQSGYIVKRDGDTEAQEE